MADLAELVGTLLAGLTHARRIADEESAAIAEYYKTNPLLESMSVPRVRVPELTLEIPVLIESHDEGEDDEPASISQIMEELVSALNSAAQHEDVSTRTQKYGAFRADFTKNLERSLNRLKLPPGVQVKRFPPEAIARCADRAFVAAEREERKRLHRSTPPSGDDEEPTFSSRQAEEIRLDLQQAANSAALRKVGTRPRLTAEIMTAEVKERSDPGSVTHLKITMREEGLEWTTTEASDGSIARTLTPE